MEAPSASRRPFNRRAIRRTATAGTAAARAAPAATTIAARARARARARGRARLHVIVRRLGATLLQDAPQDLGVRFGLAQLPPQRRHRREVPALAHPLLHPL